MERTLCVEKMFRFSSKQLNAELYVPIKIPLNVTVKEQVGRIIHAHNLPHFIENGKF